MLVKLANSNSVLVNEEKDSVCLLESRFIPVNEKSYSARLEIGFATVGYLLETLLANIQGGRLPEQKYFQRSNWTSRLSLKNRAQFRSELRQYLQFAEKGAVSILEKYEESASEPGQTVGGFSMFYFEEDVEEQQTA